MTSETFPTQEEIVTALNPRTLHLMVFPTENCNFRCTYCFEEHIRGRMHPELVGGIKKLIDGRLDDLEHLHFSWFGGEPLMARDVIFDIAEFAHRRCKEAGVGLSSDMTTNGYFLTTAVMQRLSAAGQRQFHISLDGIGAAHDRTRPLASGKGTFDRIWKNLTALRDSSLEFKVELRVHFGTPVTDETEALCRHINQHFGGDSRFSVILQRIADLGGPNAGKFQPIPIEESLRRARDLVGVMPDIAVADPDTAEEGICYAAKPNSLLIRTDGRIGKCAVNLEDPRNTVGRLDAKGELHIDGSRLQPWMEGFGDFDPGLLSCPFTGVRNTAYPEETPAASYPIRLVGEVRRAAGG